MSPRRNVEIKCRCGDLAAVQARAEALGARDAGLLVQRDTFFAGVHARLKLRVLEGGQAELISYQRPDVPQARTSLYRIAPVEEPEALAAVLAHALGEAGTVRKRRRLLLLRRTRIHLDEVEGLGSFVELETVLGEGDPEAEGQAELAAIATALGLDGAERLEIPYVELLRQGRGEVG